MLPPQLPNQVDQVVKLFWQSFHDRQSASCALAAVSLITSQVGAMGALDVLRQAAKTVERNKGGATISVVSRDFNALVILPATVDSSKAQRLEALLDFLVVELRDLKRQAPASSAPTSG